jgi:hypothetical protein
MAAVNITVIATPSAHQRYSRGIRFVVCLGPPQDRSRGVGAEVVVTSAGYQRSRNCCVV